MLPYHSQSMARAKAFCKECGGDAIPHRLTYFTVAIDETLRPFFSPSPLSAWFVRGSTAIESRLTPHFLKLLITLRLARAVDAPDEHTLLLGKMLMEEAPAHQVKVQEVRIGGLPRNLFLATLPNGRTIAYEGIPMVPRGIDQAWWMDNKAQMKKQFRKAGFPIASGGEALTDSGALRIFKKLTPPVIVKPYSGSASRHTTLHIHKEIELLRAAHIAREVAPLALIEEELVGSVYRATVVDGKLSATLRRDPPRVVGDGTHTLTELVAHENENPKRGGPYFHPIVIDETARAELRYQGFTPDSIPEKGRAVFFNQKVNWSVGGTTTDVTDEVHPDNRELFEKAAAYLKAPVVGFDFIISDISKSYKEQHRCGFIEANSMPFFDNHHLPFEGKPRNVAGDIWRMTLAAYGR